MRSRFFSEFIRLLIWLPVLFGFAAAQERDSVVVLDIDKAVEMALELNPELKISQADEIIAAAQVREASAGALPQLTFSGNYTRNIKKPVFFINFGGQVQPVEIGSNNAYTGIFNLRQTIFDNGQLGVRKARKIARLFSQATRESTRLTEDEVILNVRQSFYAVLLAREVADVFRESLSQAEAHFENVRKKYEKGVAAEFDLLRSEVQVAEVKPALIAAENNRDLSREFLKNSIGLPLDTRLNLKGDLKYVPLSEDEIKRQSEMGLERRPELVQLELQEKMANLNVSIQKGRRLPSLFLNGSYQLQGQSDDLQFGSMERSTSLAASLDLRFNIFDGFRTSAQIQRAEAEHKRIRHQIEQVRQGIKIEIEQAALGMHEAREKIEAQQKSVQQAEKAYHIAEVRFDNGVGTQLELFDARLSLNRIKTNYLQAIYDYNIALFRWQLAVGIIQ